MGIVRSSKTININTNFLSPASPASGASGLLFNEPEGLAIDATTQGGSVTIIDIARPNNNRNNVTLAASPLSNAGTSPKNVIWNDGTIRTFAAGTIAQEFDQSRSKFAILDEGAATNLLLRSEEFDNASWTKTDTTITPNNLPAPTTSASVIADLSTEGVAGTGAVTQGVTIGAGNAVVVSIFLKRGNTDFVRFAAYETATSANRVSNWFNLNTGVMGTPANGGTGTLATGGIIPLINGWYRCTLSGKVNNGATAITVEISTASADGSATRVNNGTYNIWGAMAQVRTDTHTRGSSYIATTNATVARASDNISISGALFPYGATAHTDYTDAMGLSTQNDGRGVILSMGGGTGNDMTTSYTGGNTWRGSVSAAFVGQCTFDFAYTQYVRNQLSFSAKQDDFAASQNGGANQTDTSGTMPNFTASTLFFSDGTSAGEAYIYRIVMVPRKVPNAELPTWRNNF